MSDSGDQLVLDLPHRPALDAEDFIVSESNAAADEMIARWPDWPGHSVVLAGPEGAGKTHLAHVWQLRSGGVRVAARALDTETAAQLAGPNGIAVEDVDAGGEDGAFDERALFHLLNLAREQSFHVLLTARTMPGAWDISLPDLRSRVRSLAVVSIETPDEMLLSAVLVKLLADRQIPATPPAVRHLARHMERSMAFALRIVEQIDTRLWNTPREVTRDLARDVLAELQEHNGHADDTAALR